MFIKSYLIAIIEGKSVGGERGFRERNSWGLNPPASSKFTENEATEFFN